MNLLTICNIVASCNLGHSVSLEVAAAKLKRDSAFSNIVYEPLYHNAMHFSLNVSSATVILHGSGRGIIRGFTHMDSLMSAMGTIEKALI